MAKNKNKKPKALKVVPPAEGTPLTEEQQAIQALSQQLQATRTELAVLKQMYAEVSVQARVALSERDRLLPEVQRAQQTIQTLTDELAKATAATATEEAEEEEEED